MSLNYSCYRGDEFRLAFARIGELRSIIPENVGMMALTATVTKDMLTVIKERLSLRDPVLIGLPPSQPNITYKIEQLPSLSEFCDNISGEILSMRLAYPKTLIFCRSYTDCAELYKSFRRKMGSYFTEPCGYPDLHQFRLVDMYTRASTKEMNKKVLVSILTPNSKLRILIATTAFSMGIDCHDIRHIIHFGPPSTIIEYVQETGRAGRDGNPAIAQLYYGRPGIHVNQIMKCYGENTGTCRRHLLFKDFLFYTRDYTITGCKCCDVCAKGCGCDDCK